MALDEAVAWFHSESIELTSLSLVVETDSTIVRNRLVGKNVIFKKYPSSERMFALANECLVIMKQFERFEVLWQGRENNVERFGHCPLTIKVRHNSCLEHRLIFQLRSVTQSFPGLSFQQTTTIKVCHTPTPFLVRSESATNPS